MTSNAKAEANRRNAKKSTGPKTAVGKKRSRLNATTHGIYANHVLPGEDNGQIEQFIKAVFDELQPNGPLEETVAGDIASISLELNRVTRACQVHVAGIIKRNALAREHRDEFDRLNNPHGDSPTAAREANHHIARVYATNELHPETQDLDNALDHLISDEREAKITENAERRKRQLMQRLDHDLELLRDMQRRRRAVVVTPGNGCHPSSGSISTSDKESEFRAVAVLSHDSLVPLASAVEKIPAAPLCADNRSAAADTRV